MGHWDSGGDMVHTYHSGGAAGAGYGPYMSLSTTALHSITLYLRVTAHHCAKPQYDKWLCFGAVCPVQCSMFTVQCSAVWPVQ